MQCSVLGQGSRSRHKCGDIGVLYRCVLGGYRTRGPPVRVALLYIGTNPLQMSAWHITGAYHYLSPLNRFQHTFFALPDRGWF